MINPPIVDGQIRGALAQGVGGALLEQVVYDGEGQPQASTLMDYLLPTAAECPADRGRPPLVPVAAHARRHQGHGRVRA